MPLRDPMTPHPLSVIVARGMPESFTAIGTDPHSKSLTVIATGNTPIDRIVAEVAKAAAKQMDAARGTFEVEIPETELLRLRFVTREKGSGTGMAAKNLEHQLGLTESTMNIAAQFDSTELVKRAVAGNVGAAFISKTAAEDYVREGRILMFEFPQMDARRSFYMVRHRDRILSQPAALTMKELIAFCKRADSSCAEGKNQVE